jgi:hypothetical protein
LPRQQQQQQQQQEVQQVGWKEMKAGIRRREGEVERCASRVGELPLLDQLLAQLALLETAMMIVLFFCLRTFQF